MRFSFQVKWRSIGFLFSAGGVSLTHVYFECSCHVSYTFDSIVEGEQAVHCAGATRGPQ